MGGVDWDGIRNIDGVGVNEGVGILGSLEKNVPNGNGKWLYGH